MIILSAISVEKITPELFSGFIRTQTVDLCRRREGGKWVIKSSPFTDDWSEKDYAALVISLKNTVSSGGYVVGAFLDGVLKGFASVESEFFGSEKQYLDLSNLHVSADMRRCGIGRDLFRQAAARAKAMDAKKLYISSHSAVETQAFYFSMGCRDASEINAALAEMEPYDCQLECDL